MCCRLEVLLRTLLINTLPLGQGRTICVHGKVYNKDVSGIINKGIHGK